MSAAAGRGAKVVAKIKGNSRTKKFLGFRQYSLQLGSGLYLITRMSRKYPSLPARLGLYSLRE